MGQRNDLIRRARLRRTSPSGSGRPMSRQELADAVNAYLYDHTTQVFRLDANYIGKLEQGAVRWPNERYRRGIRAVLNAATDAELGMFIIRRPASTEPPLQDLRAS
jgi:hypothetical protein